MCFLGWIAFLLVNLAVAGGGGSAGGVGRSGGGGGRWGVAESAAAAAAAAVCAVLAARGSPATFYAYFTLPIYFAWHCGTALAAARGRDGAAKRAAPAGWGEVVDGWMVAAGRWARVVAAAAAAVGTAAVLCRSFHDRAVYSWAGAYNHPLLSST